MNTNEKVNVLVTGVGGGSVGHQILHALLLSHDNYNITVVDADPYSFGLYQTSQRYIVPLASDSNYISAMLELVHKHTIQILLAGTEVELKVLGAQRDVFKESGCLVLSNPQSVIELCGDKLKVAQWLEKNDFGTPETVPASEWAKLVAHKGFPIVGKPRSNSSGSRNVAILENDVEVERYIAPFDSDQIIFQEYTGSANDEYTVGVCLDPNSRVIDTIVLKRQLSGISLGSTRVIADRSYALSTGYSQGYIVNNPLVQEECERLVTALGMSGPANIQCRVADGKVNIFEIHPRFSGTTSLRADVGFNEPNMLIRSFLFGEILERQSYRSNVAVIRAFQSVVVPIDEMNTIPRLT